MSEPWMTRWLEAACNSLSVRDACQVAEVSLKDYLLARRLDHDFDRAALVVDQIVNMMMREAVILAALDGDSKSQALYFSKLQQPAFLPDFASWSAPRRPHESEPLPPHVAEAMIAAGLATLDRPEPEPGPARPTGPEGRPN